jgi:hypothetical protein
MLHLAQRPSFHRTAFPLLHVDTTEIREMIAFATSRKQPGWNFSSTSTKTA